MYKQLNKILKLDIGKTMMYASCSYLFLSMMRVTKTLASEHKAKQELKYERTKKTGRNRCEAATLLASVITVLLLFSKSAELLCNSICFAYPAVKSLEKFAKLNYSLCAT
ncbi:hypothetical protein T12_15083 [Trichinella patagoniensis]|uniref:Uncharacterized protein n=1 Tax=Trichinella patagoniensis TaxID=990121 RepID=A0A0V0Z8Q8_9BILA|nr:hypothetical protein T12_15083 [Trichinella patagoniensis]